MRREIKFRGKHIDGNWIYGYLIVVGDEYYIHTGDRPQSSHRVLPDSVGQFTGLKDKNGQEIFEDDLLRKHDYDGDFGVRVVTYRHYGFWLEQIDGEGKFPISFCGLSGDHGKTWIRKGTIHDKEQQD